MLGDNISGEEAPALYLSAATYGVIGMDITEEDYLETVLLAENDETGTAGQEGDHVRYPLYVEDVAGVVMGGLSEDEVFEDETDTEDTENADAEDLNEEDASDENEETDTEEDSDSSQEDSDTLVTSEDESEQEDAAVSEESGEHETRESEDTAAVEEEPVYVAYNADQIKSMIRTKRYGGNIDSMVAELANCPDERARIWEEIFAYWDEVNQPGFITKYNVNSGSDPALPGSLPNDHSLCFVVLGCGLNANGTIRPEMENRCQTALRCAQMYPNSYVLCTGGHTAGGNYAASEGGVMGNWLIEHGVDASRVIIEDASYQTSENAMKSVPLLQSKYPQVNTLVLVTSDYHVPLGALMLQAECLLDGNARVVANVGCAAPRYVNFGNGELGKQLEKLAFTGRR